MLENALVMEDPSIEIAPGPRPFAEIPSLWLKILKMDEGFMASELPRASATNVARNVLVLSGIAALASLIASLAYKLIRPASLVPVVVAGLLGAFTGFYARAGITYVCARVLGGKGEFKGQAYLQSLYSIPIGIVEWAVVFIPVVGRPLMLIVTISSLMFSIRAVKVSHELKMGRATAAVLAPLLLGILLSICLIGVVLSLTR
jgi:hypothetical protein